MTKAPIRVLVIDDSALVRDILSRGLSQVPGIEVIGTASDPYIARDKIVENPPDVLTLDVEMPRMDGLTFLKKLMPQYPIPTIMVSALTKSSRKITLDALEFGAVDFITKPRAELQRNLSEMITELAVKIKMAAQLDVTNWKNKRMPTNQVIKVAQQPLDESTDKVIAIGASTGGTEAIRTILTSLPAVMPGIVIVQHMPPGFTRTFAEKLDQVSKLKVEEANEGDRIFPGRVLIAPGDRHMLIRRRGGEYRISLMRSEEINGHRPSVSVLMKSMARDVGKNGIGLILTGMGHDGADGLKLMRDAGAQCFAQDKKSSVVFGMPQKAYEYGGAESLVPLSLIATKLMTLLSKNKEDEGW